MNGDVPGRAWLRTPPRWARAAAAACVSGSAAEPSWRSPLALSHCQLLACPHQSPGSTGRALPPRVRLCARVAGFPKPGLFLRAIGHCLRVAVCAHF